jgi:hypothetical protein
MELRFSKEEYMATRLVACEALWLRKLLLGLFRQELEANVIHCDNQSCVKLSENSVFHDCRKNIDIKYHFIQYCVHIGVVRHDYIQSNEKMENIFTKELNRQKFEKLRD